MSNQRLLQLMKFLEEAPNDPFTLYSIAFEYKNQGELGQAIHFFEQLFKVDPQYLGAFYQMGKIYEQKGEERIARDYYKKGIDIARKSNDPHTLSELKRALTSLEDEWE